MHDSHVAIPLATMTAERVTNLYDLMDSAYDVAEIRQHSGNLNHAPIIDINLRATAGLKQELAQETKRQPYYSVNTTVLRPCSSTRSSRCSRRARASTRRSMSRPRRTRSSGVSRWLMRSTCCSMIGPSSRSEVT